MKRLLAKATPQAVGAAMEEAAPEWALNAGGNIKKDLAKIPIEKWKPIGNWMMDRGIVTPGATKTTIKKRLEKYTNEAGITKMLEQAPQPYNPTGLVQKVDDMFAGMNEYEREKAGATVQKVLKNILDETGMGKVGKAPPSLADMNKMKSRIQGDINWKNEDVKTANEFQRRIAGLFREDIDEQARAQLPAKTFEDYLRAKSDYAIAKTLLPGVNSAVAGEAGNAFLSPTAWATGGGVAGALGGLAAGPVGIAAGLGGVALGKFGKERGSSIAAPFLRSAGRKLQRTQPGGAAGATREATAETLQRLMREIEDEFDLTPTPPAGP